VQVDILLNESNMRTNICIVSSFNLVSSKDTVYRYTSTSRREMGARIWSNYRLPHPLCTTGRRRRDSIHVQFPME